MKEATLLPPIVESVDDPDVCEDHGVEYLWYDDGSPESGPGEPYLECPECRDERDGIGMLLACWDCTRAAGKEVPVLGDEGCEMRKVVRIGGVVASDFDPTQSYVLECGHTVI